MRSHGSTARRQRGRHPEAASAGECWLGGSRRSMPSVTGSWRRRGSNGSFVASKPLDVQLMPVGRDFASDGFNQSRVAVGAESQLLFF